MHKNNFPNHAISKKGWWEEQTSKKNCAFTYELPLAFFSPSRQAFSSCSTAGSNRYPEIKKD